MVLSRFFKQPDRPDDAEPDDADDAPEALPDVSWADRARAVLPMGTSTGSKRPEALWGATNPHTTDDAPTHYLRATGCIVTTTDDTDLIDCTMALGAVALLHEPITLRLILVSAAVLGGSAMVILGKQRVADRVQ